MNMYHADEEPNDERKCPNCGSDFVERTDEEPTDKMYTVFECMECSYSWEDY